MTKHITLKEFQQLCSQVKNQEEPSVPEFLELGPMIINFIKSINTDE